MARKYTAAEIDEMRHLVRRMIEGPTLHWQFSKSGSAMGQGGGGPYNGAERKAHIEDRIRTYIMAGVGVQELRDSVAEIDRLTEDAYQFARLRDLGPNNEKAPSRKAGGLCAAGQSLGWLLGV